jgi:hypothetical protein
MARFNSVSLDSVYLTDDGTSGGIGCKCEISGIDGLKSSYAGNVVTAVDGTPHAFILPNIGQGVPLVIKPYVITSALLGSLNSLFNTAISGDAAINVLIAGDTGSFDLSCIPALPKPLEFSGKFLNGRIYDVAINLVVVSIN